MRIYRTTLIVMALFVTVALCMIPASADTMAQDIVINSDDTVLGTIISITLNPDAGAISVTITNPTRGINVPQPAKVGDTLLQNDMIMLLPGAFAKVKFADRPDVSTLSGGTAEGAGFVIRRGESQLKQDTYTIPTTAPVVVGKTVEPPLKKSTYTIPKESGRPTSVTIYNTGGKTDYIVRGGEKILVKQGMEIKSGDEIFIIGVNSIELSNYKFLSPGTIWTIKSSENELENELKNVVGSVPDQGFFESFFQTIIGWFKPFEGISEDIGRGAKTFLPNSNSQED